MNSHNQYQLNFNTKLLPKYNKNQRQPRYAPQIKSPASLTGNWKNYLPNDLDYQSHDSSTSKNSLKQTSPSYYQTARVYDPNYPTYEEDSYIKSTPSHRKDQEQKRKEDMLRRVKQLQDKVLPMVEREHYGEENETIDFGWQARVEQKIARLQTEMDNLRKQLEINMQKRLFQIENRWQSRFNELKNGGN